MSSATAEAMEDRQAHSSTDDTKLGGGTGRGMSFRTSMALCFLGVAVVIALLYSMTLTIIIDNEFDTYTRSSMDEVTTSLSQTLSREYEARGSFSSTRLASIVGANASVEGLGIQILNDQGTVIYDNTWMDPSSGSGISLAPSTEAMSSCSVTNAAGEEVGMVRAWVYGSDSLLTMRDLEFRTTVQRAVIVIALIGALIAIVMGLACTRILTRPLNAITDAARRLGDGDLSARSGISGADELGTLGTSFDAMAESIEADRGLQKRLTSDVAHELRTPLQAILATVECMEDGVYPCDNEHLAMISAETRRLSRLVGSMLHLSRLESGSVTLDIMPIEMVSFTDGIANYHRALMAEAGLTMDWENETGCDEVYAEIDADTATQALTNLLSNASRYTPAPGTVTVRLTADDDAVHIAVSDTGIGMTREQVRLVFERFWRAEESRNRAKGGLGVGMAVTKEIMDRHHGRIDVDSEPGVGTTFTLTFPRVQPAE